MEVEKRRIDAGRAFLMMAVRSIVADAVGDWGCSGGFMVDGCGVMSSGATSERGGELGSGCVIRAGKTCHVIHPISRQSF
jgi:hypothetical protein